MGALSFGSNAAFLSILLALNKSVVGGADPARVYYVEGQGFQGEAPCSGGKDLFRTVPKSDPYTYGNLRIVAYDKHGALPKCRRESLRTSIYR